MVKSPLTLEKEKYTEIQTKLSNSEFELMKVLDGGELKKRYFTNKSSLLKDYLMFLSGLKENGFLLKVFKDDMLVREKIRQYLNSEKGLSLYKLSMCAKCKCTSCTKKCNMSYCTNCTYHEYVKECDNKSTMLMRCVDKVDLYSFDREYFFDIAAYLVVKGEDGYLTKYAYLIETIDYGHRHILKYYKLGNEEHYESILGENGDRSKLEEINQKFKEMGVECIDVE